MTDTPAVPALTWTEPPDACPICGDPKDMETETVGAFWADYRCGFALVRRKRTKTWSIAYDSPTCRNAETAAVAQRLRAEDAERDYAALLEDYNAAAAWLGVLESGDDLEVAVKSFTDQLSDAIQRADELGLMVKQVELQRDIASASIRVLDDRADALAAQVETLTAILRRIRQWDMLDATSDGPFWKAELDAALAAAPDPNAPSLDDFTHWPFPPEMPPTAVHGSTNIHGLATYNSWDAPPARDAQDGA